MELNVIRGVEPNPSVGTIYRIALKALQSHSDGFIALGGGSVIDAAKAANVLVTLNADDIHPYFGVNNIEKKLDGACFQFLQLQVLQQKLQNIVMFLIW